MKVYKMKKPRIKKEYMYLIIVLLLGLILSSFIKPFMEGFREGATTATLKSSTVKTNTTKSTSAPAATKSTSAPAATTCTSSYALKGSTCYGLAEGSSCKTNYTFDATSVIDLGGNPSKGCKQNNGTDNKGLNEIGTGNCPATPSGKTATKKNGYCYYT